MKKGGFAAALSAIVLCIATAGFCACGERTADTKKPVIEFNMAYELVLGETLKIEYTATDNVGVVSETVSIKDANGNDITLQVYDKQTGIFTPLTAGKYSIVVEAKDAAGNLARDIFTVTVSEQNDPDDNNPGGSKPAPDTQKPVITFGEDMQDELLAGNSMEVKYTATDNVGVVYEKVTVKKGNADVTDSVYHSATGVFTPTEAGEYTIIAEARDAAGNTAAEAYTVTVTVPVQNGYELPSDPDYGNSVSVHDPSIFYDDTTNKYYAFGTHFAVASSDDLLHWRQEAWDGDSGAKLLYGTTDFRSVLSQSVAIADNSTQNTWAPDVQKIGNKYYMYYSLTSAFGSSKSVIGRVSSNNVLGPYSNEEIIVWSTGNNSPNCIDPELFYDKNGGLWLVYGSFFNGIYIKQLDAATGLPLENGVHDYGKLLWKGSSKGVEGPFIFYNAETDYYYLMTSDGSLSSDYNMRVARSKNPDGPYTDITGKDMASAYGGGNKLAGNYKFEGDNGWAALGHNSVIKVNGQYLVVCHARYEESGAVSGGHSVQVRQLYFNEEGWPVLAPNRYAGETLGKMTAADVVGKYDIILHSTGNNADFIPSSRYTLAAGGTVTSNSAAVGSWELTGDHYITVTINGTAYRGVVAPCWNLYRSEGLLCITATSSGGQSLWANGLPKPQSLESAGITVISKTDGNATNKAVSAFDASKGFAVSFNLASAIPAGTPNDWNAVIIRSGDMQISLPNITNGEHNLYPSLGGNYNTAAGSWDSYLGTACYVTVSVSENGIQFYKNGVMTQNYPSTAGMSDGSSLGAFIAGLLGAVSSEGFSFAGGTNVNAQNLVITQAVTQTQAFALYENLG